MMVRKNILILSLKFLNFNLKLLKHRYFCYVMKIFPDEIFPDNVLFFAIGKYLDKDRRNRTLVKSLIKFKQVYSLRFVLVFNI